MTRLLYELAGADENLRFSPYCWRAKLALAHKNLDYQTIPWRFTEKEAIAFSGGDKVPVLVDGETTIHDSQAIAEYLDEAYPNEPPLFGESAARGVTNFVRSWADRVLQTALVPILVPDIFLRLAERDKSYFRQSREARLGRSLEELAAHRADYMAGFKTALTPLLGVLKAQKFVAGDAPAYADHIVFGALQWARLTSSAPLFDEHEVIGQWMQAVLKTYGLETAL